MRSTRVFVLQFAYASANPRLLGRGLTGQTAQHELTQECADDPDSTVAFPATGRYPRVVA